MPVLYSGKRTHGSRSAEKRTEKQRERRKNGAHGAVQRGAKQEAHAADELDHLNMSNHKKAPTLLAARDSQLANRDSHSQGNPIYIHSGQFKSRKAAEKYKLYLTKNNK